MKHTPIIIALIAMILSSCDRLDVAGMFISPAPSTQERVNEWMQYNETHGKTILYNVPDNYRVYVCSDIHITDSCPRFRKFLQSEKNDPLGLFSIMNGDIANKSGENPFKVLKEAIMDYAQGETDTCFVTIGNHDIYFDCHQYFKQYFGTSCYDVEVNTENGSKDLWMFFDSGNATLGKAQLEKLRKLTQESERKIYRHVIVSTHTCLFRTSYNYSTTPAANLPEEEYYELLRLCGNAKVDLFLMGHFHHKEFRNFSGVDYVMTSNLNTEEEPPSYVVVNCGNDVKYCYENL